MKNMFKLMGIALIASALLLTSCKKDEEENVPENNTPEATTPAINVVFGSTTWTSDEVMDRVTTATEGVYEFSLYKTGANEASMMVRTGIEKGSTYRFYGTNYGLVYWDGTGSSAVEYNTVSEDSQINITDVDATNLKLSAAIAAKLVLNNDTTVLSVTLNNAKWADTTK